MARISVEELQAVLSGDRAPVVLDVRTHGARMADPRRIPGARTLEFGEIETKASSLPGDREIVLYCT